ncbi:MAG: helix-turn-helix domain-containing protein [Candidatus Portnoybacteria bacterium]|nr:helix-turn-helix domain-containing protein [Candidatus Portnoybacteria bacterium]
MILLHIQDVWISPISLNLNLKELNGNKIMIKQKEFYLVEELANKLRVSNMTIYRYIKAGKIKAYKIGKEFRIDDKEFNKFLNRTRT